jgi:hypothetical protein
LTGFSCQPDKFTLVDSLEMLLPSHEFATEKQPEGQHLVGGFNHLEKY